MTTPWKVNQRLYNQLVEIHEDDKSNFVLMESEEIVNNALDYFKEKSPFAVYPAKSYAVAIVYATFISETFEVDFYDVLNDPDLFLGEDESFQPYEKDPENYDQILKGLKTIPDWRTSGWAPQSFHYSYLECTEEGLEEVVVNHYN